MKFTAKRPPDMNNIASKIKRDIKTFLAIKVTVALHQAQRDIEQVPVYTGKTLSNFRWSLGDPITDLRAPIKEPRLPGKTSTMAIGEEPRREANALRVRNELEEVLKGFRKNPFQKIFLRNNMPNFDDIEYGVYSSSARTPAGGITRRAENSIRMVIKGINKR
jgi:hypothetical protein